MVPLFYHFEDLASCGCIGVMTKGLDLMILWFELVLGEDGLIAHLFISPVKFYSPTICIGLLLFVFTGTIGACGFVVLHISLYGFYFLPVFSLVFAMLWRSSIGCIIFLVFLMEGVVQRSMVDSLAWVLVVPSLFLAIYLSGSSWAVVSHLCVCYPWSPHSFLWFSSLPSAYFAALFGQYASIFGLLCVVLFFGLVGVYGLCLL